MFLLTRRAALAAAAGLALAVPVLADDPPRVEIRRAEKAPADGLTEAVVVGGKDKVYLHKAAALTAADIASARAAGTPQDPSLEITFTEAGAKKAAKLSEDHADRPLAVLVGGKVVAAPVARAKFGGTVRVTGSFTAEEAAKLAKVIGGK
jgi:preprotein translocase subunit SecD